MLSLFANKAAQEGDDSGRGALVALAAADPAAALHEATRLLRQVAAGAPSLGVAQREALIRQIDDAVQRHARALGREYLTMVHLSDDEELRLWRTNRDFWAQLSASYYACLSEAHAQSIDSVRRLELARLGVRLLRAYGARLKWDQFRYWPASEAVWQIAGRTYLWAAEAGFARREVAAYHGERQLSTVEQEYLRMLVFQLSSTDSLLPFEIEIAERIVSLFLPRFSLSENWREGCVYWVDAEQRRGPCRVDDGVEATPAVRYIATADAGEGLEELRAALEHGQVPPHLELARYRSPRIVLPVVRHLAGYWSGDQPKRQHDRHKVRSEIAVVLGLEAIHRCLASTHDAERHALWSVEDVSQGGMRARLSLATSAVLRIGTLLGMRPAGGDNWLVGVVRRFAREGAEHGLAGIQTLSKHPVALLVDAQGEQRIGLLLDAPDEGERVRIVLPALAFRTDSAMQGTLEGESLVLQPEELLERGAEFDLAAYRVQRFD